MMRTLIILELVKFQNNRASCQDENIKQAFIRAQRFTQILNWLLVKALHSLYISQFYFVYVNSKNKLANAFQTVNTWLVL